MRHDRKFILRSLDAIRLSGIMSEKMQEAFPQATVDNLIMAVNANLLSEESYRKIRKISPLVAKINGNLWLISSETQKSFDFIGDGLDEQPAIELQNITVEKEHGDSYSIYISSTDWLQPASPAEIVDVNNFLLTL